MTGSLADHFVEEKDEVSYNFIRSDIRATSRPDDVVEALAALVAKSKSDPDVTSDLLSTLGWSAAVAALRPGRASVAKGDFGEVLVAEAAEAFDGAVVPVRKLRYQVDPNQTLPGSDVVAFVLDDGGEIDMLDFIESKYRATPSPNLAVDAHDQIAADRRDGYGTTLSFVANRLHEQDSPLYEPFMRYLADRGVRDSMTTVGLSFDEMRWNETVVTRLDDLPDILRRLRLRLFFLKNANELIEAVYERVLGRVLEDD